MLSPLGAGHHHVDSAAATPGAHQPIAPLGNGGLGAVPLGHLRRIGLGPVTARLAPGDKSDACRSRCRASWADLAGASSAVQARGVISAWRSLAVVHVVSGAGRCPSRGYSNRRLSPATFAPMA